MYAGTRVVRVRCPPNVRPGQSLQITVSPEPVVSQNHQGMASLTSAVPGSEGGGAVPMTAEIERANRTVLEAEEASRMAQRQIDATRREQRRQSQSRHQGSGGRRSPQPEDADGGHASEDPSIPDHVSLVQQQAQQQQQRQRQRRQRRRPSPPPPQPQAYMVTVPAGVLPGEHFRVLLEGRDLMVQCPPDAGPGMQVRINPPPPPPEPEPAPSPEPAPAPHPGITASSALDRPPDLAGRPEPAPRPVLPQQMFEVIVPPGVLPNQPFALLAGGQRVLVTCPATAGPGQKIRFQLPVMDHALHHGKGAIESLKMSYVGLHEDGWTRTIRVTDMKFQWVRMDEQGDVDLDSRFDVDRSAYVRRLVFLEGNDPRTRTGILSLVPAAEAAVDSRVVASRDGQEIVSYSDIVSAQSRPFPEKALWFQDQCSRLTTEWNEGHMRINVRRSHLLEDSMGAVMSMSRDDMRKIWRFEFMGETGVDAGGLAREFFQLVTEQIFDPDIGLWLPGTNNQMAMRINPASKFCCPEDHIVYFRFLGRVMGKALFDRQLVSGHMARHLYKHILGWPITFDDLSLVDEVYHEQLKKITEVDDVSYLVLDFTTQEDVLGAKNTVELVPDGENVDVTNDNLPEYLEACMKYRMLDMTKVQMAELLLGFFDVIPEPLLTVFDFQELELLMCGLPTIDVDDWMANTLYSGLCEKKEANHKVCRWFWEVVRDDFDQEMRARLLQFVTGTSGVPSRGFSVLQGNDGSIKKFTINGVDSKIYQFPRAHTCFNRIDLPLYVKKKDLLERLKAAITSSQTFDLE